MDIATWLASRLLLAALASGLAANVSATEARPGDALASLDTTRSTYLVVYRRGDGWVEGKAMGEQPRMAEHFSYYIELHRQGRLIAGGGFGDGNGGAAVFEAPDDAAAAAILAADPAVQARVFGFELHRWKPNPWEAISQKRAARETPQP